MDELEKLQKGCGKQTARKDCVFKNYKGSPDDHIKCGDKYPKGYVDKRQDLEKYPRFLCFSCKKKINKMWEKPEYGLCPSFPIVEVEWFDAQSSFGQAEFIGEAIESMKQIHSFSVGYLLNENEEGVLLGFMLFGEDMVKHNQLIPKGMIKNIKRWNDVSRGYHEK